MDAAPADESEDFESAMMTFKPYIVAKKFAASIFKRMV